jgi:nucleoside-diphosphate-sugar epimerase
MSHLLPVDDLDLVLSHTASFWSRFRGCRLFITGGTGFIGSWLIQTIQRANDTLNCRIELIALSRDIQRAQITHPRMFDRHDTHLVRGDIRSFTLPGGPLDLCIHAATDVADPGKTGNPLQTFDSIVNGTARILDLAQTRGASRFLLTSSGAIYGTQPPKLLRVPENYVGAPDCLQVSTVYGNAKRAAEWLTSTYASTSGGMDTAIARIFALIGPGIALNGPLAAGNFVRDILTNQPIVIGGDGRPVRSYLYTADLCVWLLRILESGQSAQAYNVGSEHPLSIFELAEQLVHSSGIVCPIHVRQPNDSAALPPRYVPDTRKARKALQLQEITPLQQALKKTIQWSRTVSRA